MNYKDEIIKALNELSGSYSVHSVYADWVEMMAMSFSNAVDSVNKEERERKYQELSRKYSEEQLNKISEITGMLSLACEEKFEDVLGYVYMHLEGSSKALGQFFTPYHICQLVAKTTVLDDFKTPKVVNEPSCGAGGNIIALAEWLYENGINYQENLQVVCQDLDWRSVYMTYVQMYLYGIPARVIHCNSLADQMPDHSHIFVTEKQKQIEVRQMLRGFMDFFESFMVPDLTETVTKKGQLSMFDSEDFI